MGYTRFLHHLHGPITNHLQQFENQSGVVDSIAFDLLYNGLTQSNFAGIQYWNKSGYTGAIARELSTTTGAIRYLKELSIKIIKNKIIGVTCHNSIKLAKIAIRNKADYLAFGAFNISKTKKIKHKANLKLLIFILRYFQNTKV